MSSYAPPHVSVNQILTRSSQNLVDSKLLPTFVGTLNQVVKRTELSLAYPVTSTTISYLGLKPGAIINQASVKINVDNAVVLVATATAAGCFVAGSTTVTDAGGFATAKVGDTIVLPNAGGSYIIASKTSDDVVELTTKVSYVPASGNYTITRLVPTVEADFGNATYNTTTFTITQLKYGTMDIISGTAYLSYIALRKDLPGYYEMTNYDQLVIDMDIDPESGIGFYLGQIALAANGGTTVLGYILLDDTLESFNEAWSELAIRKDVYFVVPVSTDATVNGGAAAHAIAMADPDTNYFRMALVNTPIVLTKKLATNNTFTVPGA
jgi:hypothetical protein